MTPDEERAREIVKKGWNLSHNWMELPVTANDLIREVAQALARERAEENEACALKAEEWTKHPCKSHDDDPCCHARTGASIANHIRARQTSGQGEKEACAKIADEHWPESGHVPSHPDAVSCPMSISILIRRRARQTPPGEGVR